MPAPGVPNNPDGVNSFDGFGTEEPYGQKTRDAALAAAVPVASGPIKPQTRPAPASPQQPAQPVPQAPPMSPEARLAQQWQAIAAIPGASDLVKAYAEAAAMRLTGG